MKFTSGESAVCFLYILTPRQFVSRFIFVILSARVWKFVGGVLCFALVAGARCKETGKRY